MPVSQIPLTSAVSGTLPLANGGTATTGAPAFSAYRSGSGQSVSANTWTKIQCQTEEFDTNNNYDNSTNYRFTPTVAGYYQFSWGGQFDQAGSYIFAVYKNGSRFKNGNIFSSTPVGNSSSQAALIYANGSTDYFEMYALTTANASAPADQTAVYFQASMVRSA